MKPSCNRDFRHISRPWKRHALITKPLKITWFDLLPCLMVNTWWDLLPPWFMLVNAHILLFNADGLPDISRPTSKPSVMPRSAIKIFASLPSRLLHGYTHLTSKDLEKAVFDLPGDYNVTRAPTCSNSSSHDTDLDQHTSDWNCLRLLGQKESAVCTALQTGQRLMLDRQERFLQGCRALNAGITRNSENAPVRLTPTPVVLRQRWVRPPRQLRQWPHVWCDLRQIHDSAISKPRTSWPVPTTTHVFVTYYHRYWDCVCDRLSRFVDIMRRTQIAVFAQYGWRSLWPISGFSLGRRKCLRFGLQA